MPLDCKMRICTRGNSERAEVERSTDSDLFLLPSLVQVIDGSLELRQPTESGWAGLWRETGFSKGALSHYSRGQSIAGNKPFMRSSGCHGILAGANIPCHCTRIPLLSTNRRDIGSASPSLPRGVLWALLYKIGATGTWLSGAGWGRAGAPETLECLPETPRYGSSFLGWRTGNSAAHRYYQC